MDWQGKGWITSSLNKKLLFYQEDTNAQSHKEYSCFMGDFVLIGVYKP